MKYKGEELVLIPNFGEETPKQEVTAVAHGADVLTDPSNVAQREKYIERIEVLSKVKGLLLLDGAELATTHQVAGYYEVSVHTISNLYQRNRAELESDGMALYAGDDLRELKGKTHNESSLQDAGLNQFVHRAMLFTKRAILRVGMLLRDSEVAKEVRTQLLNIEENTSKEVKVVEINKEQELTTEAVRAMMAGDVQGLAVANAKIIEYKNRHIEKVEEKLNEVTEERDVLSGKVSEFIESSEVYTFGEVAEEIDGLSAKSLREFLQERGVLGQKTREGVYRAIGKYRGLGWFSIQTRKSKWTSFDYTHTYITTKGRIEIAELYKKVKDEKHNAEKSA
ncbi:phage antirepressor KilAC domain-containing protein [Bacillus sp. 123MFChir2]|uniref:phage antirepressor KilAC domain-containing protein n=1 Tax=Bacillus sp. 123MFChir2 TaxID=1169144 RepID=UPI0003711ED2|nr:phage antirepressor KilAC domain-containing protein [Bacillus sp. 123MFChir2]